jgi:PTS system mannose-specific IIA component
MIGCLVISHGSVARSLVDASEQIVGKCDCLYSLSSDGLTLKNLKIAISDLIERQFHDGLIILVCLQGGSGWNVCRAVANERDNTAIISGANLPMVLSFVTKRKQLSLQELADAMVSDGSRGIHEIRATVKEQA